MRKFNLESLIAFNEDPSELDGRTLAGLVKAGLVEAEDGKFPKLTKGAKTLLRAAEELGWTE